MLVLRDENKTFHSNLELLQFIVVVEQLQLHFNSFEVECLAGLKLVRQMGSMADFSAFPFVQQAQQSDR